MVTKKDPVQEAPCRNACPAQVDVPRYVRLIAESRFDDALSVVREKIPFPTVCGRVCYRPCEEKCNGNNLEGPVAIRTLKRYVAERDRGCYQDTAPETATGKKVAVIGAGPAGLTAAYYLRKLGHQLTVFEALSEPGGMMRFGIPDYRLPKPLLDREIENIRQIGIDIETNTRIDRPADLLAKGFDAVFVSVGAHRSTPLAIEGEQLPEVLDSVCLMRDLNSDREVRVGTEVIVIGGGNAAIDAARSSLRLGSGHVSILYRRGREEMPAYAEEIDEALSEGITIEFLTRPVRIEKKEGRLRVHCNRTRLGQPDESGRKAPETIPGSEFVKEADCVVVAIGQSPDVSRDFDLSLGAGDRIQVDPDGLETSCKGIFAGGDAVSGPASVIEAIAAGREAAVAIDRFLGGKGIIDAGLFRKENPTAQTQLQGLPVGKRVQVPVRAMDERLKDFSEVELGYSEEQAVAEASRCLRCDLPINIDPEKCTGCFTCVMRCAFRHGKTFAPSWSKVGVIALSETTNEILFSDQCDSCGICARYCPHDALYRGQRQTPPEGAN